MTSLKGECAICEPTNSIVQYPPEDDGGTPTEVRLSGFQKVLEWGKKVAGWLHFCKMGGGHSDVTVVRESSGFASLIPQETKYEALWWDRQVRLDGNYYGHDFDKGDALKAATTYAQGVSIGSLTALRRFLETSLRKTERPASYVQAFGEQFLLKGGRDEFFTRLRAILKVRSFNYYEMFRDRPKPDQLEHVIRCMLGFTRKRKLLVPAWSEDDQLWKPTPGILPAS